MTLPSFTNRVRHYLENPGSPQPVQRQPTEYEARVAHLQAILAKKRVELNIDTLVQSVSEATGKEFVYAEGVRGKDHLVSEMYNSWEFVIAERDEGDFRRTYTVEISIETDLLEMTHIRLWGGGQTLGYQVLRSPDDFGQTMARAFLNPRLKKEMRVSWDHTPSSVYEWMD
jgi:hypothetical protein